MLFVGGGTTLAAAGTNVLLQTIVEDRLRGRVAGFYTIALGGVTPLGALAAGALAGVIGAPATFLVNGALAALVALWFWRRLPGLRLQVRDRLVDLGVLDEA
jgi:MFS family permease